MTVKKILGFISIDVKNNIRNRSYIRLLLAALLIPFFIFPNEHLLLDVLLIEPEVYIQFSHSSWVSIAVTFCAAVFYTFYCLIHAKNTLSADADKYSVIFISRFGRISYYIGKYFSNAIQALIPAFFLMIGSLIVAVTHYPVSEFSFHSFFSPFFVLVPSCCFVTAVTMLIDVVFSNRKINILGTVALIIIVFITVLPVTDFGQKADITGSGKIEQSIKAAGYESTGVYPERIMVLGSVPDEMRTGNIHLQLNGLYHFQDALISGLMIMAVSFLIVFLSSVLFRLKSQSMNPSKYKKSQMKQGSNKKSNLSRFISGKNALINTVIVRIFTQMKENKASIFLYFAVNLGCSIFLPLDTFQLIFLPISFILLCDLISAIGTQDHKNSFIKIFRNLPNQRCFLLSSALSSFILIALASAPSLIAMILAGQFISVFTFLSIILFFIGCAGILAEITKDSKVFQILYILFIYIIVAQPGFIGIAPGYTDGLKAMAVFATGFIMFAMAHIMRKSSSLS